MALKNPVPPPKKDELDEPADQPGSDAAIKKKKKKNSRRKHRNSHLGCGTCKKRRIKCDENLPACLNCTKGKLHCAYLNLDSSARSALRMAQHNQNIRQERPQMESEDPLPSQVPQHMPMAVHTLPGQEPQAVMIHSQAPPVPGSMVAASTSAGSPMAGSGPSFAVPYPLIQAGSMAVPPQHVIQSPYGPLVSIQPIAAPIQYSQVPVMAGQMPVIYSQVPLVQDGNGPHQPPQQAAVPAVVPQMPGAANIVQSLVPATRMSVSTTHPLGVSEGAPAPAPHLPSNEPPSQGASALHSSPEYQTSRLDTQLTLGLAPIPIPLSMLAPPAPSRLAAEHDESQVSPTNATKKEEEVGQKIPLFSRGIAGSYTALPALQSSTISLAKKLSKSAESTPIIAAVNPVITSTATVIPGIKSESSGEDSDREVRLPPIKNLNVSEVEKRLDTESNVPKISKLIS